MSAGDGSITVGGTSTAPSIAVATNGINNTKVADGALSPAKIAGTAATLGANVFNGNQSVNGTLNVTGAVSAGTQYNIGGSRVLSIPGTSNTFVGAGAGQSNATGVNNSFFGAFAGQKNTTGSDNSFFGNSAGSRSTTGNDNAFFGREAGALNTTGGNNAFFGRGAGLSNTTESFNTFIGVFANGAPGITNATAVGANAQVTQSNSLVLGNNASVGIGISAPKAKLHVQGGHIHVGTAGQGIILKSPNGATCRLLTISNAGVLTTTAVACP